MVQLSVINFHFIKPGLIKHVLLVSMSEPWKIGRFINIYGSGTDFFSKANFTLVHTNGKRNRPFPGCCEPHYESEAKCKTFHMKISFVCI